MIAFDKITNMQVPDANFNCRQKADLMNTSSHAKSDADVNLLVACKVQLSSEVIRWKTESLRLQKECNVAQQKGKELDQTVFKLLEKTEGLETQLMQAKEDNKHLRLRNILIDDTKTGSMQRLSQSLNKFNSFPTASNLMNPSLRRLSGQSIPDSKEDELAVRQVTQEMLQQMKQEMNELKEINSKFISDQGTKTDDQTDCKEELEESISSLVSEASSLKHCLLEQQKKLHSLIRDYSKDLGLKESISAKRRNLNSQEADKQIHSSIKKQASRHKNSSDNLVVPLRGISELHVIKGPMKDWNKEDKNTLVPERICPICQQQFDTNVPQDQFEEHVCDHLVEESDSFLEQFVML